jgi:hypothetical protein
MRGETAMPEARLAPDATPVKDVQFAVTRAMTTLAARTGRVWTTKDLQTLTQADLARAAGETAQGRGLTFALRFPQESNAAHGVLTWDPQLLEQEMKLEASGRTLPRPIGAPRLFLSYRWSQSIDEIGLIDYFAGRLHMVGYDIVFDRDPRYLGRGLEADDVLLLMYGCTHFVPFVGEEMTSILEGGNARDKSPVELEWDLALTLRRSRRPLGWLGIQYSGDRLPKPLTKAAVADVRESWDTFDQLFPRCAFRVESSFKDGRRVTSEPLKRTDLPDAIAAAQARRGCVEVTVHDVTKRSAAWSPPSPRATAKKPK